MSSYRGRTGPNFSEYLNSLNTVSPPYENTQFTAPEELDLNQELAMFTNTDFTHFDIPALPEDGSFNFDLPIETKGHNSLKYEDLLASAGPSQGFNNASTAEQHSPTESAPYYSNYNTPIQPAPAHGFPAMENSAMHAVSDLQQRRKDDTMTTTPVPHEEKSRVAAEEDKRRRNTAASARFRVKKKQREQALERTVKEASDKNSKLEAKINQLEMENKWLKDLITEKNGMQSREEIAAAYHKYRKESEERELKASEHTTGVGTD